MKKIICIMLSLTFLLTGCSSNIKPVVKNPDKPKVENTDQYVKDVKDNTEINNYKDVVIDYSDKDEKVVALKDMGYDLKETGYALYPNNDYFYPEYINLNGKLEVVYLPKTVLAQRLENWDSNVDNFAYTSGSYAGGSSLSGLLVGSMAMDSIAAAPEAEMAVPSEGFVPIIGGNLNTSEYNDVKESGFLSVKTNPLSTFAADVDTASYTNFRNILRQYMSEEYYYNLDDMHDVRIEEMLNYFNYNFETSNDVFTVNAEIATTPWNNQTQLLVLNVAAKELAETENKGSNLVFLVDTSGSMNQTNKLPLVKESLKLLVNELTENDTVSIVTYSGHEEVVIDGATGANKEELLNAIDLLVPYGSTNGEGGMRKAYEIAEKYQGNHSNSRIIMCSDGDLNVGISSESELHDFVEEKRETGIYLSVLGFGDGNYKDNKMETLADNGNGNYYYIDNIKEGYKVLVEDLMSTLITIADDVKFQIEFNPEYIKGYRKIGYENRDMADSDFHDDTKDGGEVGYGHSVTIVYEIIPANSEKEVSGSNLKYQETTNSGSSDWLTVSVRYKDHGEKESKLVEYIVNGENYSESVSDNWKFISNVVGFGLIINNSDYKEGLTIEDIISGLNDLELNDKDKEELLSLVIAYNYYLEDLASGKTE